MTCGPAFTLVLVLMAFSFIYFKVEIFMSCPNQLSECLTIVGIGDAGLYLGLGFHRVLLSFRLFAGES
jgi:hypothetical protein